jgi:hypothetical protein
MRKNNNSVRIALIAAALFTAAHGAMATTRIYQSLEKLAASSTAIAVVHVSMESDAAIRRTAEEMRAITPYRYATGAKVVETLKGRLPSQITVFHMSGRDDCLFQQGSGDYLVFLTLRKDRLIPTDGWPSSKFIKDDRVTGWNGAHSWNAAPVALDRVLLDLKKFIGTKPE